MSKQITANAGKNSSALSGLTGRSVTFGESGLVRTVCLEHIRICVVYSGTVIRSVRVSVLN